MVKYTKVKLILLGDTYIGKSSILNMYKNNYFCENISATIGVDFVKSTVKKNNNDYSLYIWDTSGQEKFNSIILSYYRNISVILLVFDLSNRNSFVNLNKWLRDISHYSHDNVIIKLIGNKCDKTKIISVYEIKQFCIDNNINFSTYIEVSAKNNINIDKIFDDIVSELDFKLSNCLIEPCSKNGITVVRELDIEEKRLGKKNKCCVYL